MKKLNLVGSMLSVLTMLALGSVSQGAYAINVGAITGSTLLKSCPLSCFGMQGNVARAAGLCNDC